MRKTEQAEQFFRAANAASMRFKDVPENLQAYHQFMAQGMQLLAACIRDVYDKLEGIHHDVRARPAGR